MHTTIIHTKATIDSILSGYPDGVDREYILNPTSNTHLDSLVFFANELLSKGQKSFIEVKFQSKYTNRNKRIEVVGIKDNMCYIYKFSAYRRYDKDAIEVDRIAKELTEIYSSKKVYVPSLIFSDSSDVSFVKESIFNMGLNVNVIIK
jgi:hypothetical protein